MDVGVTSLCSTVRGVSTGDVHANHVPQVALQRTPLVAVRSGGRVGHLVWFHHGHDRAGLLWSAAVGHGAGERTERRIIA